MIGSADRLVTELNRLGVHFVTGGGAERSTPSLPSAELLAGLASQSEARLRLALIPLLLVHPELATAVPEALTRLPKREQLTLKLFYTAAVILQQCHTEQLRAFLGQYDPLPDRFATELGMPSAGDCLDRLKLRWTTSSSEWPGDQLGRHLPPRGRSPAQTTIPGGPMVEIGSPEIQDFLQQLGARYPGTGTLYLLGGSALCLLGSARRTIDIDYTIEAPAEEMEQLRTTIEALATEMKLDLEAVPIEEFIPLPEAANTRHRRVDQFGGLTVYVYDPYSIALSKVARGFETDLEDVLFMLRQNLIEMEPLANYIVAAVPQAWDFDIDPAEMRQHLAELRRLYQKG